jgi:lipoate-protein ligase A
VKSISFIISHSKNPYHNLALEELLAKSVKKDEAILYLWQNSDTVVVGKHQNVFSECNYTLMKEHGVYLARRKTGGGAVFHDDKNLNFTFINHRADYDLQRNQSIIKRAMSYFGLECQISGRNDISFDGRKFSGNAFFMGKDYAIHHGTIMLDVDLTRLEQYLTVDPSKLLNKGVASVKACVINLKTVAPHMSIDGLKEALVRAFEEEYAQKAAEYDLAIIKEEFEQLQRQYASEEFLLGNNPIVLERRRKPYGELMLAKEKGNLTVFSDCLDVSLIDRIKQQLAEGKTTISIEDASPLQKEIIDDLNVMLMEELCKK